MRVNRVLNKSIILFSYLKAHPYLRSGQACRLHGAVSSAGPKLEQSLPFPLGSGLVQVLSLTLVPPPHVLLHLVQSAHLEYPPSTSADC